MIQNNATSLSPSLAAFARIIEQGAKLGIDIVESLAAGASKVLDGATRASLLGARSCTCEIPPPCWMPQPLAEVASHGRAGNIATITFVITNCGLHPRKVTLVTTTQLTGIAFSTQQLLLGPMQRAEASVSYTIPPTLKAGARTEILLWVLGCKVHFLRWTINFAAAGADTSCEVRVQDCPELVHHWYDHFYCPRPCRSDQRDPRPGTGLEINQVSNSRVSRGPR